MTVIKAAISYIEDIIEASLKACLAPSEIYGEAFNIAYGESKSLIDVYYILANALGKDIKPLFAPARKGDIKHSAADISKARRLMNFDPEYDLLRGINEAIEWYKMNLV